MARDNVKKEIEWIKDIYRKTKDSNKKCCYGEMNKSEIIVSLGLVFYFPFYYFFPHQSLLSFYFYFLSLFKKWYQTRVVCENEQKMESARTLL